MKDTGALDLGKQREQVQSEAEQQRREVQAQAEEAEARLREQYGEAERQAEAQKATLREAEALEQRRRGLPQYQPTELGTAEQIAEIEKQKEAVKVEVAEIKEDIAKQKTEVQASITEQESKIIAEIKKTEEAQEEFEAENVQLDTGEWINRTDFEKLGKDEQKLLVKLGVKKFNKQLEAEAERLEAENVLLDTNEYINKADYAKLNKEQKAFLNKWGIEKFNTWQENLVKQAKAWSVQLDTGETVDKIMYNKLSPDDKKFLNKWGVDKFNEKLKAERKELIATHMVIGNQTMLKSDWDKLTREYRTIAVRQGFDAMIKAIKADNAKQEALQAEQKAALGKLASYAVMPPSGEVLRMGMADYKRQTGQDISLKDFLAVLTGYNVNKYLKDNPGDTKTLETAGFSQDAIKEAIAYNQQPFVKETPLEDWWKKVKVAGGSRLNMYEFQAFLKKHPELAKEGRAAFTAISTSKITALPKTSLDQFVADFMIARGVTPIGLISTGSREQQETRDLAVVTFGQHYGGAELLKSTGVGILPYVFAPARALQPEVTLQDIQPMEWAVGAAQLATFALPFAGTGIAQIAISGTAGGIFTYSTVRNWKYMTPAERGISIAIDVALLATAIRGIKLQINRDPVFKAATKSGKAYTEMKSAINKLNNTPMDSPNYAQVSSNAQKAINASLKADKTFATKLTNLTKISTKQLTKLEKATGLKGLKQAIMDVGEAQTELNKAWKAAGELKFGGVEHIKQMANVELAQANLAEALETFTTKIKPRYVVTPSAGYAEVIRQTESNIARLETAISRIEQLGKRMPHDEWLEMRAELGQLQFKLSDLQAARVAGLPAPEFYGYKMVTKPIGWLTAARGEPTIGILRPPSVRGRPVLAVLEKAKTVVEIKKGYQISLVPEYAPPVPKVTPRVAVPTVAKPTPTPPSVFPGIQTKTVKTKTTVKEGYDPSYRDLIYEKPDVREQQNVYIEAVGSVIPGVHLVIAGRTQTVQAIEGQTKVAIANATKAAIKAANQAALKNLTASQIKAAIQAAVQTQVKAITQTQVKTQVKTLVKTITKLALKVVTPVPKIKIPFPWIILPDGTSRPMTEEEFRGSVAWKQGFIYKLIYPPYGVHNIINSRKPIPGVKVVKGIRSAYLTIVRLAGKIPAHLARDMGIMDIEIITPRDGKPQLRFRRDIKQRTRVTPMAGSIR